MYKVFYFSNQRLNNHSIFNLLYFLCSETFSVALVNAFYQRILDVYTHFRVDSLLTSIFYEYFVTWINCHFILQLLKNDINTSFD